MKASDHPASSTVNTSTKSGFQATLFPSIFFLAFHPQRSCVKRLHLERRPMREYSPTPTDDPRSCLTYLGFASVQIIRASFLPSNICDPCFMTICATSRRLCSSVPALFPLPSMTTGSCRHRCTWSAIDSYRYCVKPHSRQ